MNSYLLRLEDKRRETKHWVHFILSCLTGGMWIVVWLMCVISDMIHNSALDKRIEKLSELEYTAELSSRAKPYHK